MKRISTTMWTDYDKLYLFSGKVQIYSNWTWKWKKTRYLMHLFIFTPNKWHLHWFKDFTSNEWWNILLCSCQIKKKAPPESNWQQIVTSTVYTKGHTQADLKPALSESFKTSSHVLSQLSRNRWTLFLSAPFPRQIDLKVYWETSWWPPPVAPTAPPLPGEPQRGGEGWYTERFQDVL